MRIYPLIKIELIKKLELIQNSIFTFPSRRSCKTAENHGFRFSLLIQSIVKLGKLFLVERRILGFGLILLLNLNFFILLSGCEPLPAKKSLTDRLNLLPPSEKDRDLRKPKALWFATSNYTSGGTLGRLDLIKGSLRRSIREIGRDSLIMSDPLGGFFLLERISPDRLSLFKDLSAQSTAQQELPKSSNAQNVLRDFQGSVWLTSMDSNSIQVFDRDLKNKKGEIDLTRLSLDPGKGLFASLGPLLNLNEKQLLVAAQRVDRSGRMWHPHERSGFALVDVEDLTVKAEKFWPLMNPLQLGKNKDQILIVGAGDYTEPNSRNGELQWIKINPVDFEFQLQSRLSFEGKIVAVDLTDEREDPLLIVWYPRESQSCIQQGSIKIICDGNEMNGGFVFNQLLHSGSQIYVSYNNGKEAQIWMIQRDNENSIEKVPMELPVVSMGFEW